MLLVLLICIVYGKEIILSAGVDKYALLPLEKQYMLYKSYKQKGLITGSSVLAYYLSENGTLESYNDGEELQYNLKHNLNLSAYPCLFCDSTIGACDNLFSRLNVLYSNETYFIEQSIYKANKYGWDGYYVDFEFNMFIDYNKLTNFILKWAKALYDNNLILNLWIGDTAYYNMTLLYNNKHIKLTTMTTYLKTSDIVKIIVEGYYNVSNIMYGLLTYMPDNPAIEVLYSDLSTVIELFNGTEAITLWASNIPESWYNSLLLFG
jgi:hypothetical protein